MRKNINISIEAIWKDIPIYIIVIGTIILIASVIPLWLIGLIFITIGFLGIILNEFNKAM